MSFIDISVTSFLFLPLLSFLILIFFGNKIKEKSHFVALPLIGITLLKFKPKSFDFCFIDAQ